MRVSYITSPRLNKLSTYSAVAARKYLSTITKTSKPILRI